MKRGQTDIYIYKLTSRLYESIGPEGRCFENCCQIKYIKGQLSDIFQAITVKQKCTMKTDKMKINSEIHQTFFSSSKTMPLKQTYLILTAKWKVLNADFQSTPQSVLLIAEITNIFFTIIYTYVYKIKTK